MVLYRKYRPKNFAEVVGQEHVVETLQGAIQTGRLAHAYLFTGPRGTGKTSLARLLAKVVNCDRSYPHARSNLADACAVCSSCKEASNALLKTLEEPPAKTLFILATTEPHKVLPTIVSRVQKFDFKKLNTDQIISKLQRIALAEKIEIEK